MSTCRFCKEHISDRGVHYGARHWAHFDCYLDAGKPLSALTGWQIGTFPYRLLKERGLYDEATRLVDEKNAALGKYAKPVPSPTSECIHDWEAPGAWGVIIGASKCKRCGKVSQSSDFTPCLA